MTHSDDASASSRSCASTSVFGLLELGIPLTLLMDLAAPTGPDSAAIYFDEIEASSRRERVQRPA